MKNEKNEISGWKYQRNEFKVLPENADSNNNREPHAKIWHFAEFLTYFWPMFPFYTPKTGPSWINITQSRIAFKQVISWR